MSEANTAEAKKAPPSTPPNTTKTCEVNKSSAESQSVANKAKAVANTNKSEFPSETKKKSPTKSCATSSTATSPKGQQKKGDSKENPKRVEKSTTAAKSGNEKPKTSPKAKATVKATATATPTATVTKPNSNVDSNDITESVQKVSIADTK